MYVSSLLLMANYLKNAVMFVVRLFVGLKRIIEESV